MIETQVRLVSDGEELVLIQPQGVSGFSREIDPRERSVRRRTLALAESSHASDAAKPRAMSSRTAAV
jgi:hypothetical protein